MPTSSLSARRSRSGSSTRWPHTTISPLSMRSNRSMQRKAVLFPEPLRPMITVTPPRCTSKPTPFSTLIGPKLLCTSRRSTTGWLSAFAPLLVGVVIPASSGGSECLAARLSRLALEAPAEPRDGVAEREIDDGDDRVDQEGLEQRVVDD